MRNEYLVKASEIVGSQAKLAAELGIKPPTLSQMISGDRPVPINKCVAIEFLTNRQVTRKDLRPNDWHLIWPELGNRRRSGTDRRLNRRKGVSA